FGEDKFAHLRIPASGLMPKVNAGFEKLAHTCHCHACPSFREVFLSAADVIPNPNPALGNQGAVSRRVYLEPTKEGSTPPVRSATCTVNRTRGGEQAIPGLRPRMYVGVYKIYRLRSGLEAIAASSCRTYCWSMVTVSPERSFAEKFKFSNTFSTIVCRRRAPMFSMRSFISQANRAISFRPSSLNSTSTFSILRSA